MSFYLPIADIQINLLLILFFGFIVGFMSGLFGVGGGFLMTPLLIFMGTTCNSSRNRISSNSWIICIRSNGPWIEKEH